MELYGIFGDPVAHSLSPVMHEAAYEELDVDADYARFHVREDRVEDAIHGATALGVDGVNVTVPHKQAVARSPSLDRSPEVDAIGAANTVDLNEMKCYNTDAAGFGRALREDGFDPTGCDALVLGAGGAARAIVYELVESGASVTVANRTVERAELLAEEFDVSGAGLEEVPGLISGVDLLVNATSVGMKEDRSPVDADVLHDGLTVFDAVYTPVRTRLLRDAEDAGADTIDGAAMLVYQGAEALEIWMERSAPVDVMDEALREALDGD
ncbi:MAG: shikimate dehydrogenase [Halobacteriota archaeon]